MMIVVSSWTSHSCLCCCGLSWRRSQWIRLTVTVQGKIQQKKRRWCSLVESWCRPWTSCQTLAPWLCGCPTGWRGWRRDAHLLKVRDSGIIIPCNMQLCMQFWWFFWLFFVYLQIVLTKAGYTVHANQGCMLSMAACKPWMTYTHPLWCENHFWWPKTGRKHPDLVGLSENGWKMVNKWKMGINLFGQSAEWYKIKPLYRCFQRAIFDTPHGHH